MLKREAVERKATPFSGFTKRRVLLVDEDLKDLLYYSAVLQHHGYEVRSTPSYDDGGTCLDREHFDVVIVSQGGIKFEGRPVLERAMEKDRDTPVLVMTRSVDMPCYLEAIQLGAHDYIEKPLSPSEIGRLVAKSLGSHMGTPSSYVGA
jgi:two-component system response regulator HydG